jgi:hypothetical protein
MRPNYVLQRPPGTSLVSTEHCGPVSLTTALVRVRSLIRLMMLVALTVPPSLSAQALLPDSARPRQAEAQAAATGWLQLVDSGKCREAFAKLTSIFQANLTEREWCAENRRSNRALGKRKSLSLRRIIWYDDPADAPAPGTYASRYVCGGRVR